VSEHDRCGKKTFIMGRNSKEEDHQVDIVTSSFRLEQADGKALKRLLQELDGMLRLF
jgi:hypothetical protein